MAADPKKIENIIKAGKPDSTEDVRSLLQAASFNARFAFDHKEDVTYEQATAPLRHLTEKGAYSDGDHRSRKVTRDS